MGSILAGMKSRRRYSSPNAHASKCSGARARRACGRRTAVKNTLADLPLKRALLETWLGPSANGAQRENGG